MLQYAQLHDVEGTLQWLDSMYAERSTSIYLVPFNPLHDFMRDDPRYRAFVARLPWRTPPVPQAAASR
jgi:hypothetical protein